MSEKKRETQKKVQGRELVDMAGEVREELESEEPDQETLLFLLDEMQSRVAKARSFVQAHID